MDFANIARRVERKQAWASVQLSTSSLPIGGGLASYSGPGGYANRACAMGLDGPVQAEDVLGVIDFFESRGEEATVEICPFTSSALVALLGEHGFVIKHFVDVFAMPLSPSFVVEAPVVPDGVVIERLEKSYATMVRAFAEANERGFASAGEPVSDSVIELTIKGLLVPTNESFMARTTAGEIIGVAASESSEGLTVLYGATVLPTWRGRGIQRALMLTRLASAVRRESDLACVMTSPGNPTARNALRLGFAMTYTRIALRRPLGGVQCAPMRTRSASAP